MSQRDSRNVTQSGQTHGKGSFLKAAATSSAASCSDVGVESEFVSKTHPFSIASASPESVVITIAAVSHSNSPHLSVESIG
jgi:hypothetical protein